MRLLFCCSILIFNFSITSIASVPIILNDTSHAVKFIGSYIDYLEDPLSNFSFNDVQKKLSSAFITARPGEVVNNLNVNSSYWTRLYIVNNSTESKRWVIELYDNKIDYYEAYIPGNNGKYDKFEGGAIFTFNKKVFIHKNFIHNLNCHPGKAVEIFFKIKSNRRIVFIGIVRTIERLVEYSNREYFLLSLFYGIIIAIALYNFFIFVSTHDITYIFYVMYVLSIGLLALNKDGLGFQFLWHSHPEWNDTLPLIASFSTIAWAVLYARTFLNTRVAFPLLDHVAILILLIRGFLFVAAFYFPEISSYTWIDVVPLLYIYSLGIFSWLRGNQIARFYVLAFTLFFMGFSLSVINEFLVISSRPLVIYGFNIGVLCEMLLLSFALSDRIKILTHENDEAQFKIIAQSKENEALKDKLNSELESKVQERTIALAEKNKELDHFIYRASHDIKGPLKSILGVTKIGMRDINDPDAKIYFDHILKNTNRLDQIVDHLLHVVETKDSKLGITLIDFDAMAKEIFTSLSHIPSYSLVRKDVFVSIQHPFYSDDKLLYIVIQNIIENSLKYKDDTKINSFLLINILIKKEMAIIDISDNGVGIEKEFQERIFDMFYKVDPNSSQSGLGLYMTKLYVEKLGGTIKVKSEKGEGTSFHLSLINHQNI